METYMASMRYLPRSKTAIRDGLVSFCGERHEMLSKKKDRLPCWEPMDKVLMLVVRIITIIIIIIITKGTTTNVVEVEEDWRIVGFEEKPETPRSIPGVFVE